MKFDILNRWTAEVQFTAEIECPDSTLNSIKIGLAIKWALKTGAYLKGAYLKGANLEGAYLKGAYLKGAYLKGAYLKGAYLEGANLEGAYLKGAYLKGAYLKGANLEGANLEGANLEGANLEGANLKGAYLEGANLEGANLKGAYLEGAYLKGAYLEGAYLKGAYLEGANLNSFKQDLIAEILKLPNEIDALRQALIDGKIDGSTYSGDCACLAGTLQKACGKPRGVDIDFGKFKFRADVSTPREQWFLAIKQGDTPLNNSAAKAALEWIDEAIAIRDHIRKAA